MDSVRRTFASFQVYNYRLYFFGQGLSMCGTWMQTVAVSWLVLQLTGSGTQLGLVIAAQFAPILLLGVAGGLVADRFDKRKILYVTQTLSALVALALGLLVASHHIELWHVYVLVALLGLATAVDTPARQSFVVQMVGPELLRNAVTLNSTLVNGARIIGPAIAGVLIATLGTGQCFLLNTLSFVAVLIALIMMRQDELYPVEKEPAGKGQIRAAFKYVGETPILRSTLIMMLIIGVFAYEFPVTLPLLATVSLHGGAGSLSAMMVAMGIGAVLGGLYGAGRGGEVKIQRLVWAAGGFGASLLVLAASPSLITATIVMAGVGVMSILFTSLGNTALQLSSTPTMRGRVMAMWSVAFQGTNPIGGPIVGVVADHTNPRIGVAMGGLASLVAAAIGWWTYIPSRRR